MIKTFIQKKFRVQIDAIINYIPGDGNELYSDHINKTGYCVYIPGFLRIIVITIAKHTINRVFEDSEEVSLSGSGGISTEHFESESWDGADS